MTKTEREEREYKSHFTDERYARKAWKEFIGTALESPGRPLPTELDKNGEPTRDSNIDDMAYKNVKARLEAEGQEREPMQAELIVEAAIIRARFQDTTFNTILDRTAGKVRDEISVSANPYEELTDEEIEMLVQFREKQAANQTEKDSTK